MQEINNHHLWDGSQFYHLKRHNNEQICYWWSFFEFYNNEKQNTNSWLKGKTEAGNSSCDMVVLDITQNNLKLLFCYVHIVAKELKNINCMLSRDKPFTWQNFLELAKAQRFCIGT